ncbi:ROK family transcriptional regulator [Cryptosporangium phraense]|uniref:ROK family transcriptional regulator n=1 Tax=Cryptosporangium phraense TaxID=2593070 RepID=A0A545AQ07_9ACTN|nr:ROK family transcriptional regulator [Cryptosporangium phraense]TQS43418.1 ROK family transcriptional regulator [Cryptosporangium phraense]
MADESGPGTPRLLRALNDRAALRLLLEHGRLTRTDVSALAGLSKPTASQMLARLEAAGLVVAVGTAAGGPGRAAQLYEVNPAAGHAVAFDITHFAIQALIVDLGGRTVAELQVPLPRRARDAIARLDDVYTQVLDTANLQRGHISHAVAGVSGAYDQQAGVLKHASHLPGWRVPELRERLSELLGADVEVENDVNLVALAEHEAGAAVDVETFVLLWSASGLGAALVLGGALHRGVTGSAGEVGFLPVPGEPLVRNVTRATGGFDRAASGRAVLDLGRRFGLHGATAETLIRRAVAAGPEADGFLDELATRYATGLAAMVVVVDPALIVLSGPLLQAGGEPLRSRVEREVASLGITAVPARLGRITSDPVLAGARRMALARLREAIFASTGQERPGTAQPATRTSGRRNPR